MPEGREMEESDWRDPGSHVLGMLLAAEESWLLLLNGGGRSRGFVLPGGSSSGGWIEVLNTAQAVSREERTGSISLHPHSLVLLRATRAVDA